MKKPKNILNKKKETYLKRSYTKKLLTLSLALPYSLSILGQLNPQEWSPNGNAYGPETGGNVGIGTYAEQPGSQSPRVIIKPESGHHEVLQLENYSSSNGHRFLTVPHNVSYQNYGFQLEGNGNNNELFIHSNNGGGNQQALFFGHANNNNNNIFGISRSTNSGSTWSTALSVTQNGRTGIGTNYPTALFDIYSQTNPNFRLRSGTGNKLEIGVSDCVGCYHSLAREGDIVYRKMSGGDHLIFTTDSDPISNNSFLFTDNANVLLGIYDNGKTQVNGDFTILTNSGMAGNHDHQLNIKTIGDPNNADINFHSNTETSDIINHDINGDIMSVLRFGKDAANNGAFLSFDSRIGGSVTEFMKIAGDGIMYTRGLVVYPNNSAFPDYVFEEEYELMEIDSLEKYININKHLPGMPDANTVAKHGVSIDQVQLTLVEKIEELTLYIIDLKKQNVELENKISNLENSIK